MSSLIDYQPLKIHFNPGKLADLAAVSFAADLIHAKIEHMREYPGKELAEYSSAYLDPAGVSIPICLRDTIDKFMKDTDLSWVEWWSHHQKNVFLRQVPADEMINCIDELVWFPDGTINYEKTARKMLDGDETTNVQKFQLACAYCFMDDVERLKKTLKKDEIKKATKGAKGYRNSDSFLDYWQCRLSDGWSFYGITLHDAINWLKNRKIKTGLKCYDEWPRIDYFFNRLNDKHEVHLRHINSIIDLESPRLTLNILTKLSGNDLNSIIRDRSLRIIKALVKRPFYFEQTIMIWKRMVSLIDNDALADIIRHVNDLKSERNFVNSLMWEIWLATSEPQKKFIVDGMIYYFTEKSLDSDLYFSPNFPLVIDIISRSDPELRYQYWSAHWPYLVFGQLDHRADIERIMKLCFANDREIENFKNTAMIDCNSVMKYWKNLFELARVKELSTYAEFCTSDPRVIHDFKKKMVTKTPKATMFAVLLTFRGYSKMADFERLLDDIFTEKESKDFLNGIVLDRDNLKSMRAVLCIPRYFRKITKFVEAFVSNEDNLNKVKLDFFENYDPAVITDRSVQFDLMAWCFNGDKLQVEKLNKLLPTKRRLSDEDKSSNSKKRIFNSFVESHRTVG